MAANRRSALCATPFFTFLVQKIFQAKFLDTVEVSDHAHMVFCKVELIQCLQSLAWVVWAFITKPDASFWKQLTRISHMGAVLSPWNTSWTIFLWNPFFIYIIFSSILDSFHLLTITKILYFNFISQNISHADISVISCIAKALQAFYRSQSFPAHITVIDY